ncbi:MAG: protein-tyrosine phosphatase family protein [Phycisphaerales bacterium JB064]
MTETQTQPKRSKAKLAASIAVLVALVAAVIWYADDGHELFWPKRWGVVQEGAIYRSGEPTLRATRRVVKEMGIRTIIDLGAHTPGTHEEESAAALAQELGVQRYRFGLIGDATGDPNDYVLALRIMNDPAHQPVWVHCAAGSERTGCLVAMHRVINEDWGVEEAYDETHEYDHDDNPYLKPMLERWLPSVRTAYLEGGQISYDSSTDGTGAAGEGETNGGRMGPFDSLVLPPPPLLASQETEPAAAEDEGPQ